MPDPAAADLVGRSLRDGRYAVSGLLGEGSQGSTLEAVDKREGMLVAIKRFQVRGARSWKEVELAEREAKVLAELEHLLLPRALEHFEEDGALYLVMEKIDGDTMSSLGILGRDEIVAFLQDAAEVLDYLHARTPPVIHRDIKPANVIRCKKGHVLVDFGSVRSRLGPPGGSTVVGTFGYMAPEQFQGRALPQTDVYAVGATALRLLTGKEPEALPHKGLAIDVRTALAGLDDPALVRVLEQMLEPDPDRRPARLGPLLAGIAPPSARRPPEKRTRAAAAARPQPSIPPPSSEEAAPDTPRRRPPPPIVRAVLVLGLAIGRLAVAMSLRVIVPLLLNTLAIVFGPALRRAAKAVDAAGIRADNAMAGARDTITRGRPRRRRRRARIENPQRIDKVEAGALSDALTDVEADLDDAVEDLREQYSRKRK
jgi:protein kinase-like protein